MGFFEKQEEFWEKFPTIVNTPVKLIGIGGLIFLVIMVL